MFKSVIKRVTESSQPAKAPSSTVLPKKKVKRSERLLELMAELEFSVATSSFEDAKKCLFKMRRIKVTEKSLLKTKVGLRLTALIKAFRKKHKRHLVIEGLNEKDDIVMTFQKLKQVKNTWKAEIKEATQKFTPIVPVKKKRRKNKHGGGLMPRMKKRVKTVEETDERVQRKAISTIVKPSWNKKTMSRKDTVEKRRKMRGVKINQVRSQIVIPQSSVVSKIRKKTKQRQRQQLDVDTKGEDGNESSDMEVCFSFF
jgi:hypothetical protein